MKKISIFHYFIVCNLALAGVVALSVIMPKANAQFPKTAMKAAMPPAGGQVTIIVLDMSGSMKTNDPNGLRCSATNAYIGLSGSGDFIGVIGLDNNKGDRGGPHNFQKSFMWTQPIPMDTKSNHQILETIIAQKSNQCRYDGSTPIYDALNQALAMLNSSTRGGKFSGSVILLTSGSPTPDTSDQIDAIKSDLLPEFKKHDWLIHTIALGPMDMRFHSFLSDLSNATSGKFYDDGNGVVPGVSPLNITPFFVDIFARQNGRVLIPSIPPRQLNNGSFSTNFEVGDFVDHLDILIVKESGMVSVKLTPPYENKLLPQVVQPTSFDSHYAIFSVQGPPAGDWQMDARGTGQFLMDSLILSSLKITILSPDAQTSVLPLGEKFNIQATIKHEETFIGDLTVTATIKHASSAKDGIGDLPLEVELSDAANSGTYQASVTLPTTDTAGSYEIDVSASGLSKIIIANERRTIRLERFPLPYFSASQSDLSKEGIINYTVDQLDPVLQTLYSVPITRSNLWPWQNPFVSLSVSLHCQIELNGKPYTHAKMNVVVTSVTSDSTTIPVGVIDDGGGFFHILFPAQIASGTYHVRFNVSGVFKDSYGDFGTTVRTIRLIRPVSIEQDLVGWLLILPYSPCLILAICILIIRFLQVRVPFGRCVETDRHGDIIRRYEFGQANFSSLKWFFWYHILDSKQIGRQRADVKMPGGLKFRFKSKSIIEVKPTGKTPNTWSSLDETPLHPKKFRNVDRLSCKLTGDDGRTETLTFIILSS